VEKKIISVQFTLMVLCPYGLALVDEELAAQNTISPNAPKGMQLHACTSIQAFARSYPMHQPNHYLRSHCVFLSSSPV
jgi:hypothetical protein